MNEKLHQIAKHFLANNHKIDFNILCKITMQEQVILRDYLITQGVKF